MRPTVSPRSVSPLSIQFGTINISKHIDPHGLLLGQSYSTLCVRRLLGLLDNLILSTCSAYALFFDLIIVIILMERKECEV
jgi:hypothetical protein